MKYKEEGGRVTRDNNGNIEVPEILYGVEYDQGWKNTMFFCKNGIYRLPRHGTGAVERVENPGERFKETQAVYVKRGRPC